MMLLVLLNIEQKEEVEKGKAVDVEKEEKAFCNVMRHERNKR